jgi:5-methylcytosine-specific restriction endonuclease McrA
MSDTLLLNSNYEPISILPLSVIGWQHAIKLMYLGRINVIETYPDWIIRSERLALNVPSVAVTKEYFHYKKTVRFSRYNMYMRDLFQCQYCNDVFDFEELTIDHVVPRAKGGKTNWDNCVTACKSCNHDKGDKQNIHPLHKPYRPDYYALVKKWKDMSFTVRDESWNKYLGTDKKVSNSNWNSK